MCGLQVPGPCFAGVKQNCPKHTFLRKFLSFFVVAGKVVEHIHILSERTCGSK